MILHKNKLIFVHTPKCAGESIEIFFTGKPFNINEFEGHPEKHWGVKQFKKHFPIEFEEYYKFSIVRNPWDRFLSWVCYRDKRYNRNSSSIKERMKSDLKDIGFVEFLRMQSYYNLLFIDGNIAVDKVLKFENLKSDFENLCESLHIPYSPLPHNNKTRHNHYSHYYDSELTNKVAELYSKDIELFGYQFEKL